MIKKVKHILILSSWYPSKEAPFLGNFVQKQAELLAKEYTVTVLYLVMDSNTLENTKWEVSTNNNLTEKIIYYPSKNRFFSKYKTQKKLFQEALKSTKQVDLIHAHVLLPNAWLFVRAKKWFNCPLVVTEHGSYFRASVFEKWSWKNKIRLFYIRKHIDQLIAVSDVLREDLSRYFKTEKIIVVPNPINTDKFIPAEKQPSAVTQFLHISTLDASLKNTDGMIRAIELLLQKGHTNFLFTFLSDEPFAHWQKIIIEKKLSNYVKFIGPLPHENIVPFYQNSDAFVLYSNYETFSIVLAEAWACGIPTITPPVGIAKNLTDKLGILVDNQNPMSLADALETILLGKRFDQQEIRRHALQYSDATILQQLNQIYAQVDGKS